MGILKKTFEEDPQRKVTHYTPKIPVGFIGVNILSGNVFLGKTEDKLPKLMFNFGLPIGTLMLAIGRSGSGKSTIIVELAEDKKSYYKKNYNIDFDVIWADIEKDDSLFSRMARIFDASSLEELQEKCVYIINDTSSLEAIFGKITSIASEIIKKSKESDKIDYYFQGKLPEDKYFAARGYPETLFVLDSLGALVADKIIEEQNKSGDLATGGNTIAMTEANLIQRAIKSIIQKLFDANLSTMCVAHITEVIAMNPYSSQQKQLQGLKQNEKITGGNKLAFMTNSIIRMDGRTSKSMREKYEGFGKYGMVSEFSLAKNRGGDPLETTLMFLDSRTGRFDKHLHNLHVLISNGLVSMGGRTLSFSHFKVSHILLSYYLKHKDYVDASDEVKDKIIDNLTIDSATYPGLGDVVDKYTFTKKDFHSMFEDAEFCAFWDAYITAATRYILLKREYKNG